MSTLTPYYSDHLVTLYHGKAEDVLPRLAPGSVDVLLTDPPYFNVKEEDWDRQWKRRDQFLAWLGGILDAADPLLTPSPTVWMFAGPLMASVVEREVVDSRFRVLNSIRWVKDAGWHNRNVAEAQRRYLMPWEAVILAERREDAYEDAALTLHKQVFAPLGRYIQQERERAGLTRDQLEVALGYVRPSSPGKGTGIAWRWEEGASLPNAETYQRMRDILGPCHLLREYGDLQRESADLRRQYEDERRAYEDLRRPFCLSASGPVTDLWTFPVVMGYPGRHPCEKPLPMIRHMLGASARPTSTILDPFVGSGSTLRAAKDAGIKAIGIEKDERWCERAALRIGQECLDFEGVA